MMTLSERLTPCGPNASRMGRGCSASGPRSSPPTGSAGGGRAPASSPASTTVGGSMIYATGRPPLRSDKATMCGLSPAEIESARVVGFAAGVGLGGSVAGGDSGGLGWVSIARGERGHRGFRQVAAGDGPFVVLVGEDGADEADHGGVVG